MRVVTYSNPDAPVGFQHIAHIVADQPGKPGKPWKLGFHPVVFRAASAEDAQASAEAWWQAELKKAEDKRRNAQAMSERMSKGASKCA
jgi:hypothetical protein